MATVPGPVTFPMGSSDQEEKRDSDEKQRTRVIPRSYAISTKEVTIEQFRAFIGAAPGIPQSEQPFAGVPGQCEDLAGSRRLLPVAERAGARCREPDVLPATE